MAPTPPESTYSDELLLSYDLVRWENHGIVLPAMPDDPAHDLHPSKVAERPKVIYNAATRQYVMWLPVDSPRLLAGGGRGGRE